MAKKKTAKPARMSDDEAIVQEAYDRFKTCQEWESDAQAHFREDMKFYAGDPDNGYQWPMEVRKSRDVERRPCLTINKTRQYCLDIMNDARQNKPAVKVRPVGNDATVEGSQVMEGIVRHIEYQSNAQAVYDRATATQVPGGVGYWRVLTDYVDPASFDQEIFIRPIKDPMGVFLDPDVMEPDASDMRYGFIFEDIPRDQFEYEYPDFKDKVGQSTLNSLDWLDDKHVRRCEYYRRTETRFKLVWSINPLDQQPVILRDDQVPKEILAPILADPATKTRDACDYQVQWFKIVGDQIVERGEWVGSTIPIVRVIGEENIIDGRLDRKGHVRNLKDPQRMYNYWSSSAVEQVALQSKSPYLAPAKAIEGYGTVWGTANTVNHSVLPWNHMDDEGNAIPAPQRQEPPAMAQGYIAGMQMASEEFRMASGQYQEDLGEQSNATSGRAITARQRSGDNATYHFIDNQAIGIRYTGKILIEIIPKIYDTPRVIKILGEDGTESSVRIDPQAQKEYQEGQAATTDKIKIIFNPAFAKYSVEADIGPAYATRRQEAFNAFTQIISGNPQLMSICGDLMFKAADFPMAEELAERLKKIVPPAVLGKGPPPEVQQLTQQLQEAQKQIEKLMQSYAEERLRSRGAAADKTVEAQRSEWEKRVAEFDAMTKRMAETQISPTELAKLVGQHIIDAQGVHAKTLTGQARPGSKSNGGTP